MSGKKKKWCNGDVSHWKPLVWTVYTWAFFLFFFYSNSPFSVGSLRSSLCFHNGRTYNMVSVCLSVFVSWMLKCLSMQMNAKPLRSTRSLWWTRTRAFAIHFECLFNTDQPFNCWNKTSQSPLTVALSSTIRLHTRIWALVELTISLHESLYAQWQSFDPHHFDCWMWDTHTYSERHLSPITGDAAALDRSGGK